MSSSTEIMNGAYDSTVGAFKVTGSAGGSSSSTVTRVNDAATNATLLSANTARKRVILQNDSTATAYVKYGATATSTDFTVSLGTGDTLIDDYRGRIDCIWSSDTASGGIQVTEL